jgi:hypothetical protein
VTDLGLRALAELKHMLHLARAMNRGEWGWAYDFRNFNAQHSNRDMARFYQLIKELGLTMVNDKCWLRGMEWLIEAVEQTYIRAEGKEAFKRVLHGLLSGIRATQGINTILNITYTYASSTLLPTGCIRHPKQRSANHMVMMFQLLLTAGSEVC